jgi:glycosyltransferase involved in cell wall biosynthesis
MGGDRKKGRYIPAGVNLDDYKDKSYRKKIRKQYKVKDDETLLFFMGWLYDFSGMKEVCEELVKNRRKYPKIKVMIVGEGDLYPHLKKLQGSNKESKKQIILTGKVPFDDIPRYLSAADICLLPAYKNEIMKNIVPIKLYEYLAAGKPVIATRLKGIVKEFGEGNGIVYIAGPQRILNKVPNLVLNYEDLRNKGISFVKGYSWDVITERFELELRSRI